MIMRINNHQLRNQLYNKIWNQIHIDAKHSVWVQPLMSIHEEMHNQIKDSISNPVHGQCREQIKECLIYKILNHNHRDLIHRTYIQFLNQLTTTTRIGNKIDY